MNIRKKLAYVAFSVIAVLGITLVAWAASGDKWSVRTGEDTTTDAWRIDGTNFDLLPGTDSTHDIGSSTNQVAEGHFDALYLAGVAATGWGSSISPWTDTSTYVNPTDAGNYVRIYDAGYMRLGDAANTGDYYVLFSSDTDSWYLGNDDGTDDFMIGYGSTIGTTPKIIIADSATVTTVTIGDGLNSYDKAIIFDGDAFDYYMAYDDSADDFLIGVGSAVGTTPAISITDGAIVTFSADPIIVGTTPTLTIGDGGGEDTAVVFDGSAFDWHIGVEDAADDLHIGVGSALGTTPAISITDGLAITTYADIAMTGTTPTLTVGDGDTENNMVVFSGGSDFALGVDAVTTAFEICNALTLAGTVAISISSAEDVTLPSGSLFIIDEESVTFGSGSDWTVSWDDAPDDQLIFLSAATTATATTDPLFQIIVGASPTADQQVFGVAKGTQASDTDLFWVDEDGDTYIKGGATITLDVDIDGGDITCPADLTITAAGNDVDFVAADVQLDAGKKLSLNADTETDAIYSSTDLQIVAAADVVVTPTGAQVDFNVCDITVDSGKKIGLNSIAGLANDYLYLSTNVILDATADIVLTAGGGDITSACATTLKPILVLENNTNDTVSSSIQFVKDKGAAGADDDDCGSILFSGDDDAQAETEFAKILAEVSDASDADEAGKLTLSVMMDDTSPALKSMIMFEGMAAATKAEGQMIFNDDSADIDYTFETDGAATYLVIDGGADSTTWTTATASAPIINIVSSVVAATSSTTTYKHTRGGVDAVAGDDIHTDIFQSYDDGTPVTVDYVNILYELTDPTSGTEDGNVTIKVMSAGTARSFIELDGVDGIELNQGAADIDLHYDGDTTADFVYFDAGSEFVTVGGKNAAYAIDNYGEVADTPKVQVHTTANANGIAITTWSTSETEGGGLYFATSDHATIGTHTVLQDNRDIGGIYFGASDGTAFQCAAAILGEAGGLTASGDTPGQLVFYTSPDSGDTPVERLRIDEAGLVTVAADATISGGTLTMTSATTLLPEIVMKNTTDDTTAPSIYFQMDKGSAGADGDDCGTIKFKGDDDAQTQTDFAYIIGEVDESADANEAGALDFQVMFDDGTPTVRNFVRIEGQKAATAGQGQILLNAYLDDIDTTAAGESIDTLFVVDAGTDSVHMNLNATDSQLLIAQTAVAGTADTPLIYINDDRTGATANVKAEATIMIDPQGTHAFNIVDGTLYTGGAIHLGDADVDAADLVFTDGAQSDETTTFSMANGGAFSITPDTGDLELAPGGGQVDVSAADLCVDSTKKIALNGVAGIANDYLVLSTDITLKSTADVILDVGGGEVDVSGAHLAVDAAKYLGLAGIATIGEAGLIYQNSSVEIILNEAQVARFGAAVDIGHDTNCTVEISSSDWDISTTGAITNCTITRAQFVQDALKAYTIPIYTLRAADFDALTITDTEDSGDHYLILDTNTWRLLGNSPNSDTQTDISYFQWALPPEYQDGETVTLRINAEYTTIGDTQTLDVNAYEMSATDVSVGSDINETTIATLTATDAAHDFVITPAGLVAGDILNIKITTVFQDSNGTVGEAEINSIQFLVDIQG